MNDKKNYWNPFLYPDDFVSLPQNDTRYNLRQEVSIEYYNNEMLQYFMNSRMQFHREENFAISWANGTLEWWQYGKRHRLNEPAIIKTNGDKEWWHDGERHRLSDPAIELNDGTKEWWLRGKRHNASGSAITNNNGSNEWWLEGIKLNMIPHGIISGFSGTIYKYKNGKLHSTNSPAIESKDGSEWWINGLRHREDDLPAVQWNLINNPLVDKYWLFEEFWLHGKRHRENNKPAIKYEDMYYGFNEYWENGIRHRFNGPAIDCNTQCKLLHAQAKEGIKEEIWEPNKRGQHMSRQYSYNTFCDCHKEWWINGLQFTKKEFNKIKQPFILNKQLEKELIHNEYIKKINKI
jgi:hypothetical protein